MAGTWTIHTEVEDSTFNRTRMRIKGDVTKTILVDGTFLQPVTQLALTKAFFLSNESSSISGYNKLTPSNGGDDVDVKASTTSAIFKILTTVLQKAFATDAGQLNKFTWNAGASGTDTEIRGHYSKSATSLHPTDVRDCKVEYYHRTTGGTETLLGTDNTSNYTTDEAEANKDEDFNPSSQLFDTGERLVLKFYSRFQRGGGA